MPNRFLPFFFITFFIVSFLLGCSQSLDPPTRPEYADAATHWTPVILPSGMDFYTGELFSQWKNHMLIGGTTAKGIVIVVGYGEKAEEVDRIDLDAPTREVKQGPDGAIFTLTDDSSGKL